ncbi:MAG TPA: Gfo/Idh/MocA family oxidoreductase, partial [Naasia sp.]
MTRVAVIGAGAFAQVHLGILQELPRVELTWICDPNGDAAAAAAERFGAARSTPDYREALADDSVDAVDIVTPNHLHVGIAIAAAEAGKHVICEKPL